MSLDDALDFAIGRLDVAAADQSSTPQVQTRGDRYALTQREREVLALVVAGRSDGDIARTLFISKKTASVHVANIKGKLAAESRIGIVTTAIQLGLVEAPSGLAGRPS